MPMQPRPNATTAYPSYRVARPKLVGGALCLDFVNTVEWRGAAERAERLTDYGELLLWAEAAGAIGPAARRRLAAAARRHPGKAAEALAEARVLREDIASFAAGGLPRPALVERINAWLARAPDRRRLAVSAEGCGWAAAQPGEDFRAPLWPAIWSAADLLISGRVARVHSCSDKRCAWLFLDTSRSRPRRWCSMDTCGNRAKARRHYRRRRAA
jgi:predicted RNA-binding Zn ribbon-like protein